MIDEILIDELMLSPLIKQNSELSELIDKLRESNFIGTPRESIELIKTIIDSYELNEREHFRCNLLYSLLLDETNLPKEGLENLLILKGKETYNKDNILKIELLTVQSRLLIALGEFDKGIVILEEAVIIFSDSDVSNNPKYQIALKNIECTLQYRKGNLDTTLEILQGEFELIYKEGTIKDKGFLLNTLGVIYYQKGNLEKSLTYHKQSLEIRKQISNKRWIAVSLSNMGLVFYDKGEFDEALSYYQESLEIFKELQDNASMSWTLNNTAIIFAHRGQLDLALEYYKKTLSLSKDIDNKDLIALSLNNIGSMYLEKTENTNAIKFLLESLNIYKEIGNKIRISSTLSVLAYVYFLQQKLELIEEVLSNFPDPPYESLQIEGFKNMILAYTEQLKNNSGNAIKLWVSVIENKAIEFSDKVRALETLLSLYFKSWKNSESDQDLENINKLLDRLNDSANANNLIPSTCKVLLIRAKLAMAQLDFKNAENYLLEGLSKALEIGLPIYKELFNKELTFFKKKIAQISQFSSSDEQLFKQHQFQDITYSLQGIEKIFREKEKSDRLLSNILPEEVIPYLKEHQSPYTEEFESVSILFADMVDFTKLSIALGTKKMVFLLNEIFTNFDSLLDKYSAEKIRTIGDNYMVSVGVPKRRFDHAEGIVSLALEMQNYLNNTRPTGLLPKFRIGIHSGPVIASVIGRKKFQFDLLSETVNLASRMESHGLPGKIQITEETYNSIKDKFLCEKRGIIDVKGIGKISTWILIGEKSL